MVSFIQAKRSLNNPSAFNPLHLIVLHFISLCFNCVLLCVCMHAHTCATEDMCRSEDSFQELALSLRSQRSNIGCQVQLQALLSAEPPNILLFLPASLHICVYIYVTLSIEIYIYIMCIQNIYKYTIYLLCINIQKYIFIVCIYTCLQVYVYACSYEGQNMGMQLSNFLPYDFGTGFFTTKPGALQSRWIGQLQNCPSLSVLAFGFQIALSCPAFIWVLIV